MGKPKRPRQKAQARKMEAKKTASTPNTKMEVDTEVEVPFISFKNTKPEVEAHLTKVDKRELRQRRLMHKLIVGGSGAKASNDNIVDAAETQEEEDDEDDEIVSDAILKRLEKREKPKQQLKTKDKPIKKAHQRRKQYIHNVLKITTQMNKTGSKEATQADISERVKNLVAKLQK